MVGRASKTDHEASRIWKNEAYTTSNAYSHNENLQKRKNLDMLEIGDA
jgi:hypothetical protein